eukprot:TRINITY_DN11911_c0_g1_i1.p1 TRINITY_DN11911_c0_g1~~TRINITY_DN11911_c0_g1_i1.p1  ORF type:complete len:457 (+),score=60.74 TRINITY_DN11911_c0_g1_i1:48-1418(+)
MLCFTCAACDAEFLCGRCRSVRFCSAACQRKGWRDHKADCVTQPPIEKGTRSFGPSTCDALLAIQVEHDQGIGQDACRLKELPSLDVATESGAGKLVFGAFQQKRPGTRLVTLQGLRFFAFTTPRAETVQVGVWRRLGDVVAIGYGCPDDQSPCQVRLVNSESFSCGRHDRTGPLVDLYRRRPCDRSTWMFWETFWAPSRNALRNDSTFEASMAIEAMSERDPVQIGSASPGPDPCQAAATEDTGTDKSKADAFAEIYHRGIWPGLLSRSGPGSDPFHPMVRVAIAALDMAVDLVGAQSILDAACGDAAWIAAHFLWRHPEISYTGADIVSHVIEENRQRHPSSMRFAAADLSDAAACEQRLPKADLVFSKETLNHMFVEDAVHALCNLRSTKSRYLLTNIHRGSPNNRGASKGHHAHYAPYDYSLPPFNLKKLCALVQINQEDWTEYALFALQPV